jgi:hypothetical protein
LTWRGVSVSTEKISSTASKEGPVHVAFLGKDPDSWEGDSPTLFATDRTDRKTYIAQGWVVSDPQALAEIGPIPEGETIIEIPEDVLELYRRNQGGAH